MKHEEMVTCFLEIVENILNNNRKKLKECVKGFDIDLVDDEYFSELFIPMKEEICTKSPTYNKEFCLESVKEIADVYNLDEVLSYIEGKIEPMENVIYCPECQNVISNTDEYFECECGWTNNY